MKETCSWGLFRTKYRPVDGNFTHGLVHSGFNISVDFHIPREATAFRSLIRRNELRPPKTLIIIYLITEECSEIFPRVQT
jgi:hypothetical protein